MSTPKDPELFLRLKQQIDEGYMPTPLGETLGMRFISLEIGRVVVDLPVTQKVLNSMNYLHGGAMAALADTTMGFAAFTVLERGEATTTMEFKINFLRPVFEGTVRCTATVLKGGQTAKVIESETVDEQGRLICKAIGTWIRLQGDQTKGRSHG
jgi:uncharacterized protein (TIGR00369 family)